MVKRLDYGGCFLNRIGPARLSAEISTVGNGPNLAIGRADWNHLCGAYLLEP